MIYEKEMFHYLLIHFPIALFITGYLFDLLSFFKKNIIYNTFSLWNLGMGVFWAILTIISGFITDKSLYGHMESPFPIWTTHGTHMIVSSIFLLTIFIIKYLKSKDKINLSVKVIIALHTLAVIFFVHGTHIGAKLADRL